MFTLRSARARQAFPRVPGRSSRRIVSSLDAGMLDLLYLSFGERKRAFLVIEEFWFRRDIFPKSYVRWASGFKMRHSRWSGAARRVGEFRVEVSVDMGGKKFRGTRFKARARRSRLHRDSMGWGRDARGYIDFSHDHCLPQSRFETTSHDVGAGVLARAMCLCYSCPHEANLLISPSPSALSERQ